MTMPIDVVLGITGALGCALGDAAKTAEAQKVVELESRELFALLRQKNDASLFHQKLRSVLECLPQKSDAALNWHCSFGVIDPSSPTDLLNSVNAELPERQYEVLCEALDQLPHPKFNIRFATFGTVLETYDAVVERNAYLRSKRSLLDAWQKRSMNDSVKWHHFQLHTLYGGDRHHPSMFAGMMEESLRKQQPFVMSPGMQLREYHHVDDVAISIRHCLATQSDTSQPHILSSGNPIALRELAERVFRYFGMSNLLRIGALPAPQIEVYENNFERTNQLIASRDPVGGIIDWMETRGIRRQ